MLNSFISITATIFIFLFPLFYLPITSESYDYNKMALLIVTDLLLLILLTLKFVREKRFDFIKSTFCFPLFIIAAISLLSLLFISPNILTAVTTPLSVTALVSGFVFYLLLVYILSFDLIDPHHIATILIFDAILISIYYTLSYFNFFPNNAFTPAGNLLATATFLAVISVYLLLVIINRMKLKIPILKTELNAPNYRSTQGADTWWNEKGNKQLGGVSEKFGIEAEKVQNQHVSIFHFLSLILICASAILLTYQLIYSQKPVILPFEYGWAIAAEIFKNIKTFFLGVGPSNFITAFVIAKPLAFNSTPFWNVIFTSSSSFFLNLVTEIGAVAGIFYLFIIFKSLKLLKSSILPTTHNPQPITIALILSLIIPLFLPSSMTLFILTIIFLAISSQKEKISLSSFTTFTRPPLARLISGILLVFSLVLTGTVIYYGSKIYLADVYFKSSLDALLNNKPQETYNLQKKAIELAPTMDRYHLVFSQTNLALAQTIAGKKELTSEDQQYLPRLVYQAIDQARTAVSLYRTNIFDIDNLAKTYTSLIKYAAGADEWAIASYQQKIYLDPLSPSNHLALGNIFKLLNKFDLAADEFAKAIKLKSDLPNAHYQLGLVLKASGKKKEANEQFRITLSLLAAGSSEVESVKKEMESSAVSPDATTTDTLQLLPTSFPTISIEKEPNL